MDDQPSRAGIAFAAVVVAVLGFCALIYFWATGLACEDIAQADFNQVRCLNDEAADEHKLQAVLLVGAALAFIGGTVWSLRARRWAGVAAGAVALLIAFIAAFAINFKEVGPEYGEDASATAPALLSAF